MATARAERRLDDQVIDRVASQVFGTVARPAAMPMDAWRDGDTFIIEFDLPAIDPERVELDVERNVLTFRSERLSPTGPDVELCASERPRGMFSRQVLLGDTLATENIRPPITRAFSVWTYQWQSGRSRADIH